MSTSASAGICPQAMVKRIPAAMRMLLNNLLIRFLSNFTEKMMLAKVGNTIIPSIKDANKANVLVKANGRNNLPSAASMAKTGRKLTMVVPNAVVMAEDTSVVAS